MPQFLGLEKHFTADSSNNFYKNIEQKIECFDLKNCKIKYIKLNDFVCKHDQLNCLECSGIIQNSKLTKIFEKSIQIARLDAVASVLKMLFEQNQIK